MCDRQMEAQRPVWCAKGEEEAGQDVPDVLLLSLERKMGEIEIQDQVCANQSASSDFLWLFQIGSSPM